MSSFGAESAKQGVRSAADSTEGVLRSDIETLKAELARLKEDLTTTARTAASLGKHGFAEAREHVHHAADAAKQRVSDAAHFAKDKAKAGVEKTEETIKDHPFAAVGIAFGAGLLLGALLKK